MTAEEFSKLVALSQVTPGPIAVNAATYVGYQCAGIPGATVATLGVVMPSVILVYIVTFFLVRFKQSDVLQGALSGIRPATIGLLLSAVVFLAQGSVSYTHLDVYKRQDDSEMLPIELVHTPGMKTIDEVASFLKLDQAKTIKALLFRVHDQEYRYVAAFLRGDRERCV